MYLQAGEIMTLSYRVYSPKHCHISVTIQPLFSFLTRLNILSTTESQFAKGRKGIFDSAQIGHRLMTYMMFVNRVAKS